MPSIRASFASASAAILAAVVLFPNPALAASDRADCLHRRSAELAALAACGHPGSISYCLTQLPQRADLCTKAAVARCLVDAGCTAEEAQIEAAWSIRRCDQNADAGDLGDLRRRQPEPQPQATTAQPDATTTPTETGSTTRLVCSTTTTVSTTTCPVQSTGPKSGKETLPCFPTQVSFPTCAAGLLCRTDSAGNPVCMKLDNSFSPAGIVISLIFAVSVTAAAASMCFFFCRDRRRESRLRKAAEAAAIAKQVALDKKRPSVNVRTVSGQSDSQPLMPQPQAAVYPVGDGMDPFGDNHQMR